MSNALAASPPNSENSISTSLDHHTDEKAKQNTEVDSASLKNSIMLKLLQVLNNGSYEEVSPICFQEVPGLVLILALCCSADEAQGHWQEEGAAGPDGAQCRGGLPGPL